MYSGYVSVYAVHVGVYVKNLLMPAVQLYKFGVRVCITGVYFYLYVVYLLSVSV